MQPVPAAQAADPCQRRFEADLYAAAVAAGEAAGLWHVTAYNWPYVYVTIRAGDGNGLGMRILVDGYPSAAPAGQPWDHDTGALLPPDRWPTGGTASQIFRKDWSVGHGNAPYMACDRVALLDHPWANSNPDRAWNAARTIAFYLQQIHHELRNATIPGQP